MFTGIVTDVGRVLEIADGGGRRMTIGTRLPLADVPLGSSIATSGICFSAIDKGDDWFTVEASGATLEVTTAGDWLVGETVNLERSLRIGDELGGHMYSAMSMRWARSWRSSRQGVLPARGARAEIAGAADRGQGLDRGRRHLPNRQRGGRRSLRGERHSAYLARHQPSEREPGDRVNVEIDMLARYVARQLAFRSQV